MLRATFSPDQDVFSDDATDDNVLASNASSSSRTKKAGKAFTKSAAFIAILCVVGVILLALFAELLLLTATTQINRSLSGQCTPAG